MFPCFLKVISVLYDYWISSIIFSRYFHVCSWFPMLLRYFHGFLIVWGWFLCFFFKLFLWFFVLVVFHVISWFLVGFHGISRWFLVLGWFQWLFKVVSCFWFVSIVFRVFLWFLCLYGLFPWCLR